MKRTSAIVLVVMAIQINGFSQEVLSKEDCMKNRNAPVVYIPGYKDCVFDGKNISFRINPEILKNGFELKQTDTSFKIISFLFSFDFDDGITEIISTGNKILPRNDSIISLNRVTEAKLITVERIRVTRGNQNFQIPSLILYCIKE